MVTHHPGREIIAGIDTHKDTHHVALISVTGQHVADMQFDASPEGYARLTKWINSFGTLVQVGVEGTSSYGSGLTRVLQAAGIKVVEVIRPKRVQRRRGKSDPLDAYSAAANTLAGQYLPIPKQADGNVDAIRAVLTVRRSAVKAHTQAINQIRSILVTAPIAIRERFRGMTSKKLVQTLSATRPKHLTTADIVLNSLRTLAKRCNHLEDEISQAETELTTLVTRTNPALINAFGVGIISAAQLLVTAG